MSEEISGSADSGILPDMFYNDDERNISENINATSEEEPTIYLPQKTLSSNVVERILFSLKDQNIDLDQIETVDFQVRFHFKSKCQIMQKLYLFLLQIYTASRSVLAQQTLKRVMAYPGVLPKKIADKIGSTDEGN